MAFFKKKNNEYDAMNKQINNSNLKSSERIVYDQLENDDSRVASLVDEFKQGNPVVLDFGKLDVESGNKMLAFLSGAAYATDARSVFIRDGVYLFARNIDFLDGSLEEFLRNL